MSSWLPFKIPENIDIDISKRMETVKEKATMGVASLKEGAAVVSAAAEAGMQRASVGAAAGAAAVTAAAGATADKFKSQAQLVQSHERLQQTCRDCLELTGTKLEAGITSDALARQLQLRWLQLIKAAESMAAKGKGYKAQAKHEAERAEKAITAGRELQVQLRAAHQRIAELQAVAQAREHVIVSGTSSGEVRGVGNDGDSLCAAAVTPCSASAHVESLLGELTPHPATPSQQPPRERHGDDGQNGEVRGGGGGSAGSLVASTPAFLHEAEFDLKMQLSSPEMLAAAAADMTGLAASEAEGGSAGCRPLSVRIVPATGDRVQLSLEP